MLRLILLAGLSLLSGCSCDALWGRYEVPCTRGFDCPDAAIPGGGDDLRTSSEDLDLAMPTGDGPNGNSDMGPSHMGDMAPNGMFDMPIIVMGDMMVARSDIDIIVGK